MEDNCFCRNKLNNLYLDAISKRLLQVVAVDTYSNDIYVSDGQTMTCWSDVEGFARIYIDEEILIAMGFEQSNICAYQYRIDHLDHKIKIYCHGRYFEPYMKISYDLRCCKGAKEVRYDNGYIDINYLLNILIENFDDEQCRQLYEAFVSRIKKYIDNKYSV